MEVIQQVEQQPEVGELVDTFKDLGISDYIVVYLRLLTSGQLQKDAEFYENFIEGGKTVKEFCRRVNRSYSFIWGLIIWWLILRSLIWVISMRSLFVFCQRNADL